MSSKCPVSSAAPLKSLAQCCAMGVRPRWAAQPGTEALAQPLHGAQQPLAGRSSAPALAPLQLLEMQRAVTGWVDGCWVSPLPSFSGEPVSLGQAQLPAHTLQATASHRQTAAFHHRGQSHLLTSTILQTNRLCPCECLCHWKALCNEEPQGWEGSGHGTAQKRITAFPSPPCQWTVILFFQQPHCQLQWPGRRSDPE